MHRCSSAVIDDSASNYGFKISGASYTGTVQMIVDVSGYYTSY